jgi:hypothetical protein
MPKQKTEMGCAAGSNSPDSSAKVAAPTADEVQLSLDARADSIEGSPRIAKGGKGHENEDGGGRANRLDPTDDNTPGKTGESYCPSASSTTWQERQSNRQASMHL